MEYGPKEIEIYRKSDVISVKENLHNKNNKIYNILLTLIAYLN